ncbi:tumor protein p53-inducible nuclear protein 1 isoform X2 [Clupea harengus]|uniref:Tumor protein p53-inducible nuclear protein 1 isoform X2 n=1 Tax=Clupea harengus TaxID=7950 RepID=A0A8M1KED3_CLUHA|nr:tumor protein p53-inducible nuclear protein 1 isoform X2 [Clupea harengus]
MTKAPHPLPSPAGPTSPALSQPSRSAATVATATMFQRFTSILFGDTEEDVHGGMAQPGCDDKEEDDEWILVNCLAETCAPFCGPGLVEVHPEDLEDLEAPSPDHPLRSYSCSSLDSATDTDLDPEDGGFLRLEAASEEEEEDGESSSCALEESWFITPPPCFTAGGRNPVLLETSPLENLLIEHPSMSVYAFHNPRHVTRPLAKESSCEPSLHRTEVQRRPSHSTGCYAAALAAHANLLAQVKHGRLAQRLQENMERQNLSRNALRRFNLLREGRARQAKSTSGPVHQPGQRHFNY